MNNLVFDLLRLIWHIYLLQVVEVRNSSHFDSGCVVDLGSPNWWICGGVHLISFWREPFGSIVRSRGTLCVEPEFLVVDPTLYIYIWWPLGSNCASVLVAVWVVSLIPIQNISTRNRWIMYPHIPAHALILSWGAAWFYLSSLWMVGQYTVMMRRSVSSWDNSNIHTNIWYYLYIVITWLADDLHDVGHLLLFILTGVQRVTHIQFSHDAPKTPHIDTHFIG